MEKIGSFPLLEVLSLSGGASEAAYGKQLKINLKFLSISMLHGPENWISESTHFPCLEQLVLEYLHDLKEIPSDIGEIPTLESIVLSHCSYPAAVSARMMLEEQEKFCFLSAKMVRYDDLFQLLNLQRVSRLIKDKFGSDMDRYMVRPCCNSNAHLTPMKHFSWWIKY